MRRVGRKDTDCEIALRKALFAMGLRYRVDWSPPGSRSKIDVAFTKRRLAVFVDGCFWHGCPVHATAPKSNAGWWRQKLAANRERDLRLAKSLEDAGWRVLRFWSHVDPDVAAQKIATELASDTAVAVGLIANQVTNGSIRPP